MYCLNGIMLLLSLELPQDKIQCHILRHGSPPWYVLQKHIVNDRGQDTNKVKGKVQPCTGTETLYRPYGP